MNIPSYLKELQEIIQDYITSRVQLFKIKAYEKIATLTAKLFSVALITLLVSLILIFLSFGVGFFLGELLESNAYGFLIVALFYIISLIFILLFKKRSIEKYITDKVIKALFTDRDHD